MNEHDRVVLTEPVEHAGLVAGDIGTVVYIHTEQKGYEVEFNTLDGSKSIVVGVSAPKVRLVHAEEIPHARPLVLAEH